jgi:hypothetical protein
VLIGHAHKNDQTHMVPLRERSGWTDPDARNLPQLRSGIAAAATSVETSAHRPLARPRPIRAAPVPVLRCGWCHGVVEERCAGHTVKCGHCQRPVIMPRHIQVRCDRCGQRQIIRVSVLGSERMCAVCGCELTIGDVILVPRKHRHESHHHRHHRRPHFTPPARHADAAWAVLIVALTITVTLIVLTMS